MVFDPDLYQKSNDVWNKLASDFDRVERHRQFAWAFIGIVFGIPVVLGMLGYLIGNITNATVYFLACTGIATLMAYATFWVMRRGHWLNCKPLSHLALREILGHAYKPWGIIEPEEIDQHGILPDFSRLYREEGYAATIHGYRIRFQEIDAVRSFHPMSVREWYERSIRSGLYVLVELKRGIPAHTILLTKGPLRDRFKRLYYIYVRKYRPVGLVSPRFKNRFDVLSTDQVSARIAFHPAFIEKFMEIADLLNAKSMEASFSGHALLFFAHYKKDLFQLGHMFCAIRPEDIAAMIEEVKIYEELIATLKLNPYTMP